MLVSRLPQESRTQTELRDSAPDDPLVAPVRQGFGPWALTNYQLADLRDAVLALKYVTAVVGQVEPKPSPPEPTPRPGLDKPRRKQSDAAVIYLHRLREGA